MRKIAVTLMLLMCACAAFAQKYRVVSVSGGDCLVDNGNGWELLSVNASLHSGSVLRNTGKPYSEVILREEGMDRIYRVYMLEENFSLGRFVTDRSKDKPAGEVEKFSCFMMEMIRSSKAVAVNVSYYHSATSVRAVDGDSENVDRQLPVRDFFRCIAQKAGGRIDLSSPASFSSGLSVDAARTDGGVVITNYSNEPVLCYLCRIRRSYAGYAVSPVFEQHAYPVEPATAVMVPYEKASEAERLVVISSESDAEFDPVDVARFLQMTADNVDLPAEKESCFGINIL